MKFLYTSLTNFNSFILVGPPLSGKSFLVGLVINISKQLFEKDKSKYGKIFNVKIYSKSKTNGKSKLSHLINGTSELETFLKIDDGTNNCKVFHNLRH